MDKEIICYLPFIGNLETFRMERGHVGLNRAQVTEVRTRLT